MRPHLALTLAAAALAVAPARAEPPSPTTDMRWTPPPTPSTREQCYRPGPAIEPIEALRTWLETHEGAVIVPVVFGDATGGERIAADPSAPPERSIAISLMDMSSSLWVRRPLDPGAPQLRWVAGTLGKGFGGLRPPPETSDIVLMAHSSGETVGPDEHPRVWVRVPRDTPSPAAFPGRPVARSKADALEGLGRPDDPPRSRDGTLTPGPAIADPGPLRAWIDEARRADAVVRLPVVLARSRDALTGWIGDTAGPAASDAIHLRLVDPPSRAPLADRLLIGPPCGAPHRAEWLEGRLGPTGKDGRVTFTVQRWIGPVTPADRPAAVRRIAPTAK